jgi:hypothetical protein
LSGESADCDARQPDESESRHGAIVAHDQLSAVSSAFSFQTVLASDS